MDVNTLVSIGFAAYAVAGSFCTMMPMQAVVEASPAAHETMAMTHASPMSPAHCGTQCILVTEDATSAPHDSSCADSCLARIADGVRTVDGAGSFAVPDAVPAEVAVAASPLLAALDGPPPSAASPPGVASARTVVLRL